MILNTYLLCSYAPSQCHLLSMGKSSPLLVLSTCQQANGLQIDNWLLKRKQALKGTYFQQRHQEGVFCPINAVMKSESMMLYVPCQIKMASDNLRRKCWNIEDSYTLDASVA